MGGLFSRRKGIRGEYLVRDDLRKLGYKADRVPLSGAAEGFKGDVVATKDSFRYVIEVKCRKNKFLKIYVFYYNFRSDDEVLRFYYPKIGSGLVSMGKDFEKVKEAGHIFTKIDYIPNVSLKTGDPSDATLKSIYRMKEKWLQDCDILAIKNNNQPILYIKFWK